MYFQPTHLMNTNVSTLITGLTCVQMVLQRVDDANKILSGGDQRWMREYVGTESVWTIDLVRLLHDALVQRQHNSLDEKQSIRSPAPYLFCSANFGVDESYNTLDYYEVAFQDDLSRVERLFDLAAEEQLPLFQVHLSLRVLVDFVSRKNCIAIALVDNIVLRGQDSQDNNSYSGHYVIVCGVSYNRNDVNFARTQYSIHSCDDDDSEFCFVLKNPGIWKEQEFVPAQRFDMAWRANGTDQDIILINMNSL